jgi:transcriptional regulator with XRE-family HTH domain
MTIKQVAGKAELRESAVSCAENGKSVDIATLKKISVVLQQPVWWLCCFEKLPIDTLCVLDDLNMLAYFRFFVLFKASYDN